MQLRNTFKHVEGNADDFILVPQGKFCSLSEIGGKKTPLEFKVCFIDNKWAADLTESHQN